MITVTPLPAFSDNYLWLIDNGRDAVVVDPGDAAVVRTALTARGLRLAAILITHHHPDHIGGLKSLRGDSNIPVYGPRAEAAKIAGLTELLGDGDRLMLAAPSLSLDVIAVPGHTLGHIAFHAEEQGWLFCGDTLFAGGCGRLFEGTPAQMHASLSRLAALPAATQVFCAHEYTLSNLDFAQTVTPDDAAVNAEVDRVLALRAAGTPSVPTSIAREVATNPFLRSAEPSLIAAASAHAGEPLSDPVQVFATLRRWKDGHRPRPR